ncbi:molybdenum cofactor cytidylyltransferase/nicotine blue oxidoreductase [Kribbella amoyensis]|uniref:Molybdenum cofactor cytidylyltransferase/nicotine blue oxidoreductase n=1 Tax=Kribbella amoyensis TaxID=996641 RepID=A0A561BKK8_9ACTN|nr:NTP transferase domain-containing protein [Kribbella amoyensis]TWD79292.1 molybdenum cofactor cytidylyltransferase/nicotine blue oxidoreductase [Kribbella amoyensis]
MELIGVLLAAGAGTRLGRPGGLMHAPDGTPWVVSSVRVLREAGCSRIGVVVGASAPDVVCLLTDEDVTIVPSPSWSDGLSASVRAGLGWAGETDAPVAVVHMVDRPRVGVAVVRRVVAAAAPAPVEGNAPADHTRLARASYDGASGYPVVIGRAHWGAAGAAATGDRSMGPYLKRVPCPLIPCDDLLDPA